MTPDPLAALSDRRLARLARRAHRVRGRGERRFAELAERAGVAPRRLRLLADAWAEGGAAGVAALGPASTQTDPAAVRDLDASLETWRRRHYPLEVLRWRVWRNRVTVEHVVPGADRRGDAAARPLFQLRVTDRGRWHLYRKAAQGEWWPVAVAGRRGAQDLAACLDAVRTDPANQFWTAAPRACDDAAFWLGPGRSRS